MLLKQFQTTIGNKKIGNIAQPSLLLAALAFILYYHNSCFRELETQITQLKLESEQQINKSHERMLIFVDKLTDSQNQDIDNLSALSSDFYQFQSEFLKLKHDLENLKIFNDELQVNTNKNNHINNENIRVIQQQLANIEKKFDKFVQVYDNEKELAKIENNNMKSASNILGSSNAENAKKFQNSLVSIENKLSLNYNDLKQNHNTLTQHVQSIDEKLQIVNKEVKNVQTNLKQMEIEFNSKIINQNKLINESTAKLESMLINKNLIFEKNITDQPSKSLKNNTALKNNEYGYTAGSIDGVNIKKILIMEDSFPFNSKGIAQNPLLNNNYLLLDLKKNVKSIQILPPNEIILLFEKNYAKANDSLGNVDDSVTFSPDGNYFLLTFSNENFVYICSSTDGSIIQEVSVDKGIMHGAWISNSKIILCDQVGLFRVFDFKKYKNNAIFKIDLGIQKPVITMKYNPITSNLYFGDKEGTLVKFNFNNQTILWRKKVHNELINSISVQGDLIVTGSDDLTFCILNDITAEIIYKSSHMQGAIMNVDINSQKTVICITTHTQSVLFDIFSRQTKKIFEIAQTSLTDINSASINWDTKILLLGSSLGEFNLINLSQ